MPQVPILKNRICEQIKTKMVQMDHFPNDTLDKACSSPLLHLPDSLAPFHSDLCCVI